MADVPLPPTLTGWQKFIRGIDWIGRWQIVQTLMPAKYPAGFAVLTAIVGIIQHQPYMWILMAASLVFMGGTVGFVYANAWRERNSPLNKLRYITTVVNYDLVPMNRKERLAQNKVNVERKLDKTQIGVMLRNDAHFPISVILHSASTGMEELTPPRSEFPKPAISLLPGNILQLVDDPIEMKGAVCEKLEGKMDLIVKYGLLGKEIHTLEFKAKIEAMMQPVGFLSQINTNWESSQIRA